MPIRRLRPCPLSDGGQDATRLLLASCVSLFLTYPASSQNVLANSDSVRALSSTNVVTESPANLAIAECQYACVNYPGAYSTQLEGINNRGEAVGTWSSETTVKYTFTWNEGSFAPVAVPSSNFTDAEGINDAGEVVGSHEDSTKNTYGCPVSPRTRSDCASEFTWA